MGRELIKRCPTFAKSITQLDEALKSIPGAPTTWSLLEQLTADGASSQISEARFSQPLCTAVQIALVDLLRACNVRFDAVVGHSSGEIGAAYAAGLLSRRDAVGIAYYRGLVAHLAKGPSGQPGGMMAAGMSPEDAEAFCSQPLFAGRIGVAACNSPSSVTLSGDLDAIQEAKNALDQDKIFARLLKVDTAYHSHHMLRCEEAYRKCLENLNIQVQLPTNSCPWYSSVRDDARNMTEGFTEGDALSAQYWVDNMVKPVLFTQAVSASLSGDSSGAPQMALEVGPHAALKGPVGQTIKQHLEAMIPYTSCLVRGEDDVQSMSAAVGYLWSYLGPSYVSLEGWRSAFGVSRQSRVLKALPSYAWDHDQVYWHESRLSHNYRLQSQDTHELLGRLRESTSNDMTWRNIVDLETLPWMRGHRFQGQVIFPGAGYVSMAVQAAQFFLKENTLRLAEIRDMTIHKALIVDEDTEGVEVLFSIHKRTNAAKEDDPSVVEVDFSAHSCSDGRNLVKVCDGHMLLHLDPDRGMPPNPISAIELPSLDIDRFYQVMNSLDITYDGVFRTIRSITRTLGQSKAVATWDSGDLNKQYTLHPAVLDVAFQAGLAAFASVAENAIGSTYLPSGIKRIVIDPTQSYRDPAGNTMIEIETHLASSTSALLEIDINMCSKATGVSGVQIDGLQLKAIAEPQAADDRKLFAKEVWDIDAAYGLPSLPPRALRRNEVEYIDAVERTALFFLKRLATETKAKDIPSFKWHHQQLLRAISKFVEPVQQERHPVLKKEWLNDDQETIRRFAERYPDSVDLALLTAVGENISSVLHGKSDMLEHMLKDNLLSRLYAEGRGFAICNDYVAHFMGKISHKYPRTRILEVGAGTGGTTRTVLDTIGDAYSSYTYTDISAGFFEKAAEKFAEHAHKMTFKVFNAENTPEQQDFVPGSYDVIIAANVLHATRDLAQTMRNVRSLLRPGGYLLMIEVTGTMLREPGLMGGLEGWWLGTDDGRFPSPGISAEKWHDVLQKTGFSGVDSIMYDMPDIARHNCSVFATQAMDDNFRALQDPLAAIEAVPEAPVVIIGGQTLKVSKFAKRAEKMLKKWASNVTVYNSILDVDPSEIAPDSCVLCLTELDKAVFSEPISAEKLENLQELLGNAKNVLWVTSGRLAEDPHSNMMIGIGRALSFELPHVKLQFLDFEDHSSWDAELVAQFLLRMALLSSDAYRDHNMLWAQEPELTVNDDKVMIPRVVQDAVADEGMNAKRRQITRPVDKHDLVQAVHHGSQIKLVKDEQPPHDTLGGLVEVRVKHSVRLHSGDDKDSCFLCFGTLPTGESAYTLSGVDCSTLIKQEEEVFKAPTTNDPASTLVALGSALIALNIISNSPSTGTTLIYEPTNLIAKAVEIDAKRTRRHILFINASGEKKRQQNWITAHSHAQSRVLRQSIPLDTNVLFTLTRDTPNTLVSCLPVNCAVQQLKASSLLRDNTALASAYKLIVDMSWRTNLSIVTLKDISDGVQLPAISDRLSTVLDWERSGPVNVIIPPLQAGGALSPNKTYFMVGLAGELGYSLARFMVGCGVRHIALASRNPIIDATWLDDMARTGVEVRVLKMDLTDRAQVRETVSKIRETMPPIGGVANGALVLEDSLFVNTTVANIEHQLKSKVDGTIYLDEEFADDKLDFFMAFSSLGSVYGNAGQSIYHAANMFMTGLVEKRRRRGQAASVINIGMIVDVGYVAKSKRAGSSIEEHLRSQFYTPLAESEFHHLFLQGVVSGHPQSSHAGVTMGIQPFIDDPAASTRPHWYNNPRFSHMILSPVSSTESAGTTTSAQQLRERLESVQTAAEASEIFQEMFLQKIESMMKIPATSVNPSAPLSDLGLDSLLGVEIRTWLFQNMHIDVPLLRILGTDSIDSICQSAAQNHTDRLGLAAGATTDEAAAPKIKLDIEAPSVAGSESNHSSQEDAHINTTSPSLRPSTESSTPPHSGTASPKTEEDPTASSSAMSDIDLENAEEEEEPCFVPDFKESERLSFAQASLQFLQNFLDDPTTFNVTAQYAIDGPLNTTRFKRALEKTLARHDAYKTCFFTEPGSLEVQQGIAANASASDKFKHLFDFEPAEVDKVFEKLASYVWRLEIGETFQAMLLSHSPESHTLVIGCHHIIMDGSSWHILLKDLDEAYQMRPLRGVPNSYLDFTRQQHKALADGNLDEHIAYWTKHLDPLPDVLPLLPLAQNKTRKPRRVYSNHVVHTNIGGDVAQKIKEASQACRATPMQFYLAVLEALLARILEIDNLCVGVTDAGRGEDGSYSETVGHFTNLLPLNFQFDQSQSFAKLLQDTTQTVLTGYSHAKAPFEVVLERLGIERSTIHTPLFQVTFNYRTGDLLHGSLGNCKLNLVKYVDSRSPYDLSFNITQAADGGNFIEVSSNDYLYSKGSTQAIMDAYINLLSSFASNQDIKIQDSRPFTRAQVDQALIVGRGSRTTTGRAWPETLTERFGDVCAEFPNTVALKDEKYSITYSELLTRVNGIASSLTTNGASKGTHVAVHCEPSADTYAAMLAIMHIGAIYVPLDVSLPKARHQVMLETCKPQFLIFHSRTAAKASDLNTGSTMKTINLSQISPSANKVLPAATPTEDSFLLFTSGTTGTPKGIRLSQTGIMNYAASKSEKLNLGQGQGQVVVLQQSSTGFDMSIAQAFNAFANGGTLVVAPSHSRGDPVSIAKLMLREGVELTICTPSEYLMMTSNASEILGQCKSWRHACSGGEAVTDRLVSELRRLELPHLALMDCYGPTEISCAATFQSIPLQPGSEGIPAPGTVGKAIPSTSVYIVGNAGELLPTGFPGEICVGGRGVAKGYFDEKLNSAAKFVDDPFATPEDIARGWRSMYKTGDKGYLREDGSLVFTGRTDGDTLIKLRGLRIELNEVANVILQSAQGSLADAVVTVRGKPEYLVAHVVPARGQATALSQDDLERLRAELPLPRYMIPATIIALESLPLTSNGKIDRRAVAALPLPAKTTAETQGLEKTSRRPLTVAEGELRLIWRDVLGEVAADAEIGADTDFFTVGGSSLLLARLQNALKERMGVQMALQDLYQASTLSRMAKLTSNERSQLVAEEIDWDVETAIPGHVLRVAERYATATAASPPAAVPKSTDRVVLLTGATGFIGSEILRHLISDGDIAEIHCVAVPEDAQQKVPSSEKVKIYTGSLLNPSLGLTRKEQEYLQNKTDQIIHAGAQGHCLNNYTSVRQANFLSTQFLATLALPRRIPFHFLSSARVILQSGKHATPPISVSSYPPPRDGSQGFTSSKWASEKYLEDLSSKTRLPVAVHRPCSVVGDRAPHDDAMNSVVRFSLLSRKVPDVPAAEGFFDFKDATVLAEEIARGPVAANNTTNTEGKGGCISFRHHSSGVRVPFRDLGKRMENLHGGKFETVPMEEWLQVAQELGIEDLIVSYLRANVANGAKLEFPYLGMGMKE